MAGYCGYSMSNNAVAAYQNGEKSLSKWSKSDILSAIHRIAPKKAKMLEFVRLDILRSHFLYESSWHHTSSKYNRTKFYSIDEDAVLSITAEDIAVLYRVSHTAQPVKPVVKYLANFEYVEWCGKGRYKKSVNHLLQNVLVEEKGSFYFVYNAETQALIMRKKIGSNGTSVVKL